MPCLLHHLRLTQPANGTATTVEEAEAAAARIGYPVLLRPSYDLGGRAMQLVQDVDVLRRYMVEAAHVSGPNPVLIDKFVDGAVEVDVDAIADGVDVYIAGVMQQIEEAGVHSGDSACALPPFSLRPEVEAELRRQTRLMARRLGVVGLTNVHLVTAGAFVALADGRIEKGERDELLDFIDRQQLAPTIPRTEIAEVFDRRVRQLQDRDSAQVILENLRPLVGLSLASVVLRVAQRVAAADRQIHPREMQARTHTPDHDEPVCQGVANEAPPYETLGLRLEKQC
jgi:tellurite resistance protein